MLLTGDPYGHEAPTHWRVWQLRATKNGGPFQWFHIYNRCPASNNCSAINWDEVYGPSNELEMRAEPPTPTKCCQNLEPGMYCQPECARLIQNDETALASDVGLFWKFQRDPESGKPFGCKGFDDAWMTGKRAHTIPECDKEDYAPDGEGLHEIVDEYADDQLSMMKDYISATQKMIENGYQNHELTEIPDEWWFD